MAFFQNLIKDGWHIRIVEIVLVIAGAFLLYQLLHFMIRRLEQKKGQAEAWNQRTLTYGKLAVSITRYLLILACFLIVLQIAGVNVSSLIAGLGLASVIVGLALQDWLKDIIRGFDILSDSFFHVGDIVRYKGEEGEVLVLGIKTTRIRLLATDNILSIANRNIEEIEIVSWNYREAIPLPYDLSVYQAEKVVKDIVERIRKNEHIENCLYVGVTALNASSISYYLEIRSNPLYRRQVRRDTIRSILLGMEENNIAVPYDQIDVHTIDDDKRAREVARACEGEDFRDYIVRSRSAGSDSIFRREHFRVGYDGKNADEVLDGVEQLVWRMGCSRKECLQMRLLTEEMIELVRTITNKSWMEVEFGGRDRSCLIRVQLDKALDEAQKEKLLHMSSAGAAAGAGIIGKMRQIAARLMASGAETEEKVWSLREYIESVQEEDSSAEGASSVQAMEEIKRSIIANLADDVSVSFRSDGIIIEATRSF